MKFLIFSRNIVKNRTDILISCLVFELRQVKLRAQCTDTLCSVRNRVNNSIFELDHVITRNQTVPPKAFSARSVSPSKAENHVTPNASSVRSPSSSRTENHVTSRASSVRSSSSCRGSHLSKASSFYMRQKAKLEKIPRTGLYITKKLEDIEIETRC